MIRPINQAILSLLFLFCMTCQSANLDVMIDYGKDWRIANEDDNINDWAVHDAPNKLIADFDGDGHDDIARILLKRNGKFGTKTVAVVSNYGNPKQFTLFENKDMQAQSFSLELLKPSDEVWESSCQKVYYDCEEGYIRQFKITKPTLYLCYIEVACTVHLWSSHEGKFIEVPLSD